MVKVPVAEYQRVHPVRVDFQQFEVVSIEVRGEPEVQ